MSIKLLSVRNDTERRFEDIQVMITILETNTAINRQLVLKSSLMLMIYNVVEGTISNLLTEFFEGIVKKQLSIDELPNKLKNTILKYHLKKIGNNPRKLKEFYEFDGVNLCQFTYLDFTKYFKLYSGNLDSCKIKTLSEKLGINLSDKTSEPNLLKVKNARNKLAHGETKFSNCMQDITLDELKMICDSVKIYLDKVTGEYEDFLNRF